MSTYSYRITTNGVIRGYRANLMKSRKQLETASQRVQTHREFNSYAEDPTAARQAFQLRRRIWRTNDAIDNTNYAIGVYQSAWTAMDAICDGNGDHPGFDEIKGQLELLNGSTGNGRVPLGQSLLSTADSIVQMMNNQYGGNFIFAGADGHNVPFTWGTNDAGDTVLMYRGVDVSAAEGTPEYDKLKAMAAETTYVDIGIGFAQGSDGQTVPTSAFNTALSGLNVLGYGVDEDGDSKNLVTLMRELGEIAKRCTAADGSFADGDEERANTLVKKLRTALDRVSERHVEITARTEYLNSNAKVLKDDRDALDQQRSEVENIEPALAIQEMSWANYCYQAALKIGNGLLSQSLIDYMS